MPIVYNVQSSVEDSAELRRLFQELTGTDMVPDTVRINRQISEGSLAFYSAWTDGKMVGMTSVISCRTCISDKLWIEDVAVLSEWRGRGIGRAMLEFAMQDSLSRFGAGTFWLTSRPSRTAARSLYASMGFRECETGVFSKP